MRWIIILINNLRCDPSDSLQTHCCWCCHCCRPRGLIAWAPTNCGLPGGQLSTGRQDCLEIVGTSTESRNRRKSIHWICYLCHGNCWNLHRVKVQWHLEMTNIVSQVLCTERWTTRWVDLVMSARWSSKDSECTAVGNWGWKFTYLCASFFCTLNLSRSTFTVSTEVCSLFHFLPHFHTHISTLYSASDFH